jgi:hypothetical protein
MNQDENTRDELLNQNNSLVKMIIKEPEETDKSNTRRPSKYSQRKDRSSKFLEKKNIKFKDNLEDIVFIESFKTYNKKMCFNRYNVIETRKTCCEDAQCLLF